MSEPRTKLLGLSKETLRSGFRNLSFIQSKHKYITKKGERSFMNQMQWKKKCNNG